MDCSPSGVGGVGGSGSSGSSGGSNNGGNGQMPRQTKRIAPTSSLAVSPNPVVDSIQLQGQASAGSIGSSQCGVPAAGSDLVSLFECPVCFDFVLPPIIQCQNGHLVCSSCRQKLTTCPTCRVPISSQIRNLPMEKLAVTMMFPCKYMTSGCSATLPYLEKPDHEDSCEFKPYQCPCPGTCLLINYSQHFPLYPPSFLSSSDL